MKNILDKIKENSTVIFSVAIVTLIGYILLRGDNPISKASGNGVESPDFAGNWISEKGSTQLEIVKLDENRYNVVFDNSIGFHRISGIYTVSGGNLEHEKERENYITADQIYVPKIYVIEKIDGKLYFHEGNEAGLFYVKYEKPKEKDSIVVNTPLEPDAPLQTEIIEEPKKVIIEEIKPPVITLEVIRNDLLKTYVYDVPCECAGDGCDSGIEYEIDEESKLSYQARKDLEAKKRRAESQSSTRRYIRSNSGGIGFIVKTLEQIKYLKIVKTNQTDEFIETIFSVEIDLKDESGKYFNGNIAHRMEKVNSNSWVLGKMILVDCIKEIRGAKAKELEEKKL